MAIPVTFTGQPVVWAKKVVVGVTAVAVVALDLYRTDSIEAGILGALVVMAVFVVGAALSKAGWDWDAPPPSPPEADWLEEANLSRGRGTGISTLAVRYDVDADWLEAELSRFACTPRT